MERWELIERSVLLTVGTGLLLLAGWLLFFAMARKLLLGSFYLLPVFFGFFGRRFLKTGLTPKVHRTKVSAPCSGYGFVSEVLFLVAYLLYSLSLLGLLGRKTV